MLKSRRGQYLFRHDESESWRIRDKFSPVEDVKAALVAAPAGPIPTGAQTWICWHASFDNSTLIVRLLPTEVEPAAAERRIQNRMKAEATGRGLEIHEQMKDVACFHVSGHPRPDYNGMYSHAGPSLSAARLTGVVVRTGW